MQKVIETNTGWMVKCKACKWHEFPKIGKPGASWTFNGDLGCPTFNPSMNEHLNDPGPNHNPELPTRICHFIISNGQISYCRDCTHELVGQTLMLEEWSDAEVKFYQLN